MIVRHTSITADFNDPRWPARQGGKLLLQATEHEAKLDLHIIGPFLDFVANEQPIPLEPDACPPATADAEQEREPSARHNRLWDLVAELAESHHVDEEVDRSHAPRDMNRPIALGPPETWFALAKWGKDTGLLNAWERSFAFNIGRALHAEREITPKQLKQSERVLNSAYEKGFEAPTNDAADAPPGD